MLQHYPQGNGRWSYIESQAFLKQNISQRFKVALRGQTMQSCLHSSIIAANTMVFIGSASLTRFSTTTKDENWKSEPDGSKTRRTELKELDGLTSGIGLNHKRRSDVWYQA